MGGTKKTSYEGDRLTVKFESVDASKEFYRGMSNADRADFIDGGGFVILFVFGRGSATFHETRFYNAQVRQADVNRDGLITEEEAKSYRKNVALYED